MPILECLATARHTFAPGVNTFLFCLKSPETSWLLVPDVKDIRPCASSAVFNRAVPAAGGLLLPATTTASFRAAAALYITASLGTTASYSCSKCNRPTAAFPDG